MNKINVTPSPAAVTPGSRDDVTDADREFIAAIVEMYGPTIRRLMSGKTELNHVSMGRILAKNLRLVAYDPTTGDFLQRQKHQVMPLTTEQLRISVADLLQRIAAVHPELPTRELRARRISMLVDVISTSIPRVPGRDEVLAEFVRTVLCIKPGNTLTVEEIYAGYRKFAAKSQLLAHGRKQFNRKLKHLVAQIFTITQSHNLLRPKENFNQQTNRRGFLNMAFKDSVINSVKIADNKDGTDAKNAC